MATGVVLPLGAGCGLGDVFGTSGGSGGGETGHAYKSYFIGAQVDYENPVSPACQNTDVHDDTYQLWDALDGGGWHGIYHDDHTPTRHTDFIEASFFGQNGRDDMYADAHTLAVFSGHGDHNEICFREEWNNNCCLQIGDSDPSDQVEDGLIRLGRFDGGIARVALWSASCVGFMSPESVDPDGIDFVQTIGLSESFQHLAFHDSPIVDEDALRVWYEEVAKGYTNNTDEWLELLAVGDPETLNIPRVFTIRKPGEPDWKLVDRHEFANLETGEHLEAFPGGFGDWYATDSLIDANPFNDDPEPSMCESFYF